ncbi:MFS general substrate transporter [Hypoxylon trugodes]|uniref:MFS general substrate transporter n=1 Tax=Hypoxylon trugodes TaxID=326681 RepID=UPI00219750ED|nr:MFS general substrate transporter [Hypoxylon trugodes]KAI1383083.1 MFS general substrate transporter [Hypoxylon trugodes]
MDETQPLLQDTNLVYVEREDDPSSKDIVDFDPNGDAENPMEWPLAYKWFISGLLAFMAFTVTFTCVSVVPVASRIVKDLNHGQSSKSASVLLVTIWELGEAAGPLLIAPLSEIFGRYPVMNAANALFIVATILAAISQSTALFIAARTLTGLAVASNVLNPAIVGDIFAKEQRGSAMSMIQLAPLIGGAVGPAISGAIAETMGWRRTIWMSVILAVICEVAFLTSFRETYKVPILRRKAARLRRETGNTSLRTVFDADDGSQSEKFWDAIVRPFTVLAGSSVLQILSVFGSVVFTYFYIMSTTLPDILETTYGLSPAEAGSAFMTYSVGSVISVIICNLTLDRIYIKLRDSNKGVGQPEYRLPLVIIGGFTLPIIVAWYGWAAQLQHPISTLLLSVAMVGSTMTFGFLPFYAYVVDAFGLYAASAMTAVIVIRCLAGTFLPLAAGSLTNKFGYGLGFSILGGASLLLAPIPIFVLRYGAKWRQGSKYTRDE